MKVLTKIAELCEWSGVGCLDRYYDISRYLVTTGGPVVTR